ncbi:hypothetical protein B9Z55_006251 [Caenorhabditis nigoni]|uniref:DUF1248 domain-containing protein n=1 Tax=Caenorhabditis nigoni TaxID=1611254 RepID=A0A2G5V4A2_9PELO|nr:hypothetical protein B9Z55_006251 [Caenorhabditis nigoni]
MFPSRYIHTKWRHSGPTKHSSTTSWEFLYENLSKKNYNYDNYQQNNYRCAHGACTHGSKRFDFKAEDYTTWKTAWGEDYRLGLFFLKGSENLAFSFHTIQYKSLGLLPDFRHLGMAWIPEKYRGREILKVVTDYLIQEEQMKKQNMLACNVHWSQNFWKRATGKSDISACTYYISYYEMSDFKIPKVSEMKNDVVVKTVNTETVHDVLKYDRAIFPFDRQNWMKSLFLGGIGRIAYDSDGKVVGIGCLSIYLSGECVISPLYADEEKVAQAIFRSILEEILLKRNLWRMQVRSNDQCIQSFQWIQPFLKTTIHRSHLSNLCYSMYPPRHFFDFSKVFVNAHPTNGPC